MKFPSCLLLALLAPAPLLAKKKPTGQIPDPAALARVRSYCVDTSQLAGYEAYDVNGLIETENKPKKLLSKLPWKYLPDCREGDPDAIIRIQFLRLNKTVIAASPDAEAQSIEDNPYAIRALMQVTPAGSLRLLYQVEAAPLDNPEVNESGRDEPDHLLRRDAAYRAFWNLIEDVRMVSSPDKK